MRTTRVPLLLSTLLGAVALVAVVSVARAEEGHTRFAIAYSYGIECQDEVTTKICT